MMEQESFKYYAFISYCHKDQKIAKKLQKQLEHYHLPSALLKTHPGLPKNLRPVFMDETNIIATGSLGETLQKNLETSNYLILVCSPNSAKSKYVNDEVNYFIENGRYRRIIPLIIDGKPYSDDPDEECFPPAILNLPREYEPLGIDIKKYGVRDSFLRVIATMLRLDLDAFISREARERKRKAVTFASIAAVLVMIASGFVWYNIDFFRDIFYSGVRQYNIGNTYYLEGNYAKAAEWFEKAAALGYAGAQFKLGEMNYEGKGIKQDYNKSFEWFEKSAAQDNTDAQYFLASMYYSGTGVKQDYAKAVEWFEKSAAQGDADSQFYLALMYNDGECVKQDYTKAVELYEKSAAQGHAEAQFNLALIYYEGEGVKQDYAKAVELLEKSAVQGYSEAQFKLGEMYYDGECVKQDKAKAAEWFEKSAAQGDSDAQYFLASMYYNGEGQGVK